MLAPVADRLCVDLWIGPRRLRAATSLSYAVTSAVTLGISYSGEYGALEGNLEVSF
jgi:hypothetical protein